MAKKRLKRFNNVSIVCGNIIDVFPTDATFFYLFNPFDEFILAQFLEKVENITHKITVIYCNCKYNDLFRNRVGWIVREEGVGIHAKNTVMNYVIFEHMPIIH